MYDRILVPTDGSEGSRAALDEAVGLAAAFDATVHVLHVVDVTVVRAEAGSAEVLEALERAGEDVVSEALERAEDAGVNAVGETEEGTPARSIVEYAGDEGIDLIVTGTQGRTGLERYLLGSVAEKVVRTADVPVLTIRTADDD